eukprot:CAMPEP_0183832050 /NCGR_PEP_ID=MMETSP0807_2-20130328/5135_1 /TAXON_ID=88271 /ORGANISM="Picocystis salinarum, Strain CCMP1897" /LENGTH=963 /DNA_ID=CAMNT_0026077671 /DNA_START=47 /DNA_END=2938 /DNA_ORIENTATION=+
MARVRREGNSTPAVDWDALEEELREVPESFRQERFVSLPHVLEVLADDDPQTCLEALRERRERLDRAVDQVVRSYHVGFSQAIHNYAQILKRFSEAQAAANKIRRSLSECAAHADVQLGPLRRIYGKSITVSDVAKFLDEIQAVHGVPAKLEALVQRNDFRGAADVLVDASNTLNRSELQRVEGLKELRDGITKQRQGLRDRLVDEIHERVYGEGASRMGPGTTSDSSDEEDSLSSQILAATPQRRRSADRLKTLGERTISRRRSRHVRHSRTLSAFLGEGGLFNQGADDSLALSAVDVEELLECLSRLGELEVGKEELIKRVPVEIRGVIEEEVEYWLPKIAQILEEWKTSPTGPPFLSSKLHEEVKDFIGSLFISCRAILSSLIGVLRRMVGRRKNLALASQSDLKEELLPAVLKIWTAMQEELWNFITALGNVDVEVKALKEQQTEGGKSSWLWRQNSSISTEVSEPAVSYLTFSFDIDVEVDATGASQQCLQRADSLPKQEDSGREETRFVQLKDCGLATVYTLACMYRPVVEFSQIILQTMAKSLSAVGIDGGQISAALPVKGLQERLTKYMEVHLLPTLAKDHKEKSSATLAQLNNGNMKPIDQSRQSLQGSMEVFLQVSSELSQQMDALKLFTSSVPVFTKEGVKIAETILRDSQQAVESMVVDATRNCLAYQMMGKEEVMDLLDQERESWLHSRKCLPTSLLVGLRDAVRGEMPFANSKLLSCSNGLVTLTAGSSLLLQLVSCHSVRRIAKLAKHLSATLDQLSLTSLRMLQTFFIDLMATTVHYLHPLHGRTHIMESEEGSRETSLPVMHLCKILSDVTDSVSFMTPDTYSIIFADLAAVAAHELISCSEDIKAINLPGIQQVKADCEALEATLLQLAVTEQSRGVVRSEMARASNYFGFMAQPGEIAIACARKDPSLYSKEEYLRLLSVAVPGRFVQEMDIAAMQEIIGGPNE